jgi:hypothetical protein
VREKNIFQAKILRFSSSDLRCLDGGEVGDGQPHSLQKETKERRRRRRRKKRRRRMRGGPMRKVSDKR